MVDDIADDSVFHICDFIYVLGCIYIYVYYLDHFDSLRYS